MKKSNKDESILMSVRVSKISIDKIERIMKVEPFTLMTKSAIIKHAIEIGTDILEDEYLNKNKEKPNE